MKASIRGFAFGMVTLVAVGCAAPTTAYQSEFGGFNMPGTMATAGMNREDMHAAIEHAYLDGELTAEQARKAHLQLDVKGHLTQEQMAVINRERLAKRDVYETRKEQLDVIRDTTATGSSVTSDIKDTIDTIRSIFN